MAWCFGYACNDTEQLLPTAMVILQELSKKYDELRKKDSRFLPDGKAQITGLYEDNMKLKGIDTFTICYQNTEQEREKTDKIKKFLINPTGRFNIGGFDGDSGLTGRKIVVDQYQSFANVGGGAFSGKDPTKVDRSGAYKAREIAKKYLKIHKLNWCEVQLSYAIGLEKPLAIYIDSNKGEIEPPEELYEECKLKNIIKDLDLKNKCYEETAKFGHFQ